MTWYILKTEPSEYAFADLQREKKSAWTGVANPAARQNLRAAKVGDQAFIYHTGDEKAIVGIAKVVRAAYEDPDEPGFDAQGRIKAPVIDLAPVKAAKSPLTLAAIKADKRFADLALVRQGRLSVSTLTDAQAEAIRELIGA